MALSEQEQAKIHEEELARLQARKEAKRRKRPQLIMSAVLWTILVLGLALATPRLHF